MPLTVDEFRLKIDEVRPQCKICNYRSHSLVRHLKERHNFSVGQYKKAYPQAAIVSKLVSLLSKEISREPVRGSIEPPLEEFIYLFAGQSMASSLSSTLFNTMKLHFWTPSLETLGLVPEINLDFVLGTDFVKPIMFSLLKGKNTYIEGPTGCGKTEGVEQIHARLGLPCKRVNMNGDVTVANFIGKTHADVQKGTYFKYGSLPLAMKGGYSLLIDEIDYMPPNIAAVLNPVLESVKELYLPDTDEHIKAQKGFCVVGMANTGGKGDSAGVYTGTEVMNTAFLDRFAVKLTVDYLEPSAEAVMLEDRYPMASVVKITQFTQAAKEIRDQFKNGLLPVTLSTRKLIDILDMEPSLGLKTAVECAILNWLDSDNALLVKKILENNGIDLK